MINPSLLRLTRLKLELRNLSQNISRLEREKNVSKDRISQLEKLCVKVSRDNYELICLRRRVEYLQKDINKITEEGLQDVDIVFIENMDSIDKSKIAFFIFRNYNLMQI